MKAMIILHDTYNFDLRKTTKSNLLIGQGSPSEIAYRDSVHPETIHFRSRESLNYADLLVYAVWSVHYYHFYDRAIDFLKQAFDSFEESPHVSPLYEYMVELRTGIVNLHNDYLMQRQKVMGNQFRVQPYIFNEVLDPTQPNVTFEGTFRF